MKPRVAFPIAVAKRPRWARPAAPATPAIDPALARAEAERRSRLLTMKELAEYLRYTASDSPDPANAAYCYVKRHDLPIIKRGTSTLVRLGVIDDHLEAQRRDIAGRAQAHGRRSRR
jgi:hypothetical protein